MNTKVKINTYRKFENLIGRKFGQLTVIDGPLDIVNEKQWKRKQRKWLCKCDCGKEVIYITNQLKKGSTKSCGCFSKKRLSDMNTTNCKPFEWVYNNLLRCAKNSNKTVQLTFDEFLEFTKTNSCHYCNHPIEWKSRGIKGGTTPYYLDRKDNTKGYTKENCVVCCTLCNLTRHIRFTYDEMLILGKTISFIKQKRINPQTTRSGI